MSSLDITIFGHMALLLRTSVGRRGSSLDTRSVFQHSVLDKIINIYVQRQISSFNANLHRE